MSNEDIRTGLIEYTKRVIDELERFLRRVLLKLQRDAMEIIVENKAVGYTKELMSNIRYEVVREAAKLMGVVGVGKNVKHGVFRHEGTKPHFPPLEPIQKWVAYKGLAKRNTVNARLTAMGSAKLTRRSTEESRIKSIAYLIARKISQKGTTGLQFLKMSLNQNEAWILSQLSTIKVD